MRNQSFKFIGRGLGTGQPFDPCHIIDCAPGSVMEIVIKCGGIEFIDGYCRRAMIDRWGLYCVDPFRRASDGALTRSWPMHHKEGRWIYRPASLEIMKEEKWMRCKRDGDEVSGD